MVLKWLSQRSTKAKDPNWIKQACAQENKDFISIETYSGYGLAVADPTIPEYHFVPHVSDEELGQAMVDAVSKSRHVSVEKAYELRSIASENYQKWVENIKKRYGYQTKRAMFKDMKSCDIFQKNGILVFEPTVHDRLEGWSGDGFTEEDYVKIPDTSPPEEVGAALRLAFSRCR